MKQILGWSKGNPGALVFLMGLMSDENLMHALSIVLKLEECESIRGTNAYVLFNDLANKDYELCAKICREVPSKELEDACSRQDYSGRELIKDYLKA